MTPENLKIITPIFKKGHSQEGYNCGTVILALEYTQFGFNPTDEHTLLHLS